MDTKGWWGGAGQGYYNCGLRRVDLPRRGGQGVVCGASPARESPKESQRSQHVLLLPVALPPHLRQNLVNPSPPPIVTFSVLPLP
jgi:hypothetical protein